MLSVIILLVALFILAISFYQIRILKRINEKLIKLVAPERDVRRIAKAQSEAAWENYRQGEFYSQLLRLLDLSAPIPSTRSWAASPDVLLTLLDLAKSSKPARVLDLGSGMSTLVLAKSAPQAEIISIDNSDEYVIGGTSYSSRYVLIKVIISVISFSNKISLFKVFIFKKF